MASLSIPRLSLKQYLESGTFKIYCSKPHALVPSPHFKQIPPANQTLYFIITLGYWQCNVYSLYILILVVNSATSCNQITIAAGLVATNKLAERQYCRLKSASCLLTVIWGMSLPVKLRSLLKNKILWWILLVPYSRVFSYWFLHKK